MRYDDQNQKSYTAPDHGCDPEIKRSLEWNVNAFQFYYRKYGLGNDASGVATQGLKTFRDKISNNRKYSAGRQAIAQYLPLLGHTTEQIQQNKTHMAIDWRLPQIWPKFRDIMLSNMNKVEYKVSASLVDPTSLKARAQARYEMELQVKLKPLFERWNKMAGGNITGLMEGLPKELEELDIAFEMNYKEALALAAEKGIDLTLANNDWRELKKKWEEDSIDADIVACRTYIDDSNSLRISYVDPTSLILPSAADREFKHHAIGCVERLSISQIKKMDSRNEISDTEYQDILNDAAARRGMSSGPINFYVANRGWTGDAEAMNVVYLEWPSLDIHRATSRKDRHGNDYFHREAHNDKKANKQYNVPMWYGCYWIEGTNSYFGWGPSKFMNRLKSQMNEPRSSIHVYSNTWDGQSTNAITERVLPFVNAFTVAWYKFQDEVNRARPSGFWIDIDALNNVVDSGGKSLSPKENIASFLRSGVLVVNNRDEEGNMTRTPVQELPSSLQSVEPHIQTMMVNVQQIRDVTGLNEFADASTPNREVSATATNAMVNASQNALYRAVDCVNYNYLTMCRGVLSRLQQIVLLKPIEGYIHALGSTSVEAIKITADISMADIGLVLESISTPEDRMWLERQIEIGLTQRQSNGVGGIELEDALAIRNCRSVKLAERMLSIRRKRRKREDSEEAAKRGKQQAEFSAQAGMMLEQEKQRTLQLDLQIYGQKEQILTAELRKRKLYEAMWQNEIQDTKNEGGIAQARVRQGQPADYQSQPAPQQ